MAEFRKLCALVERNIKCYFKDKFLFLVSLITPMILLVLFVTFLRTTYISSFKEICASFGVTPSGKLIEGLAGAWLLSSIMAVCSLTVAVCSNAVMIQDKTEGAYHDLTVAPVKRTTVSLGYFIANFAVTFIVMASVLVVGFVYLAIVGWQISFGSVMLILLDMIICVLFGSLLSGVIESFISSQGGLSAISTLVSSMYGFICGAYMPLSQFSSGVRNIICLLPGTYSVGILRKHFMSGYISALGAEGLPEAGQKAILDAFDGNMYLFDTEISQPAMYAILLITCLVLLVAYILIVFLLNKSHKEKVRKTRKLGSEK